MSVYQLVVPCRVSYLLLHVVERIGRVDGEADQDNMRIGIRERAETVVIFLASSIPKGKLDVFTINLDIGDVVLKDGGDIDLCGARMSVGVLWWVAVGVLLRSGRRAS